MVGPAQRHREFVAHLAAERAGLREPEMMGVRGLPPTDEAGLQGDKLQMRLVAVTPRFANRQHAAIIEASAPALNLAGALARVDAVKVGCRLGRAGGLPRPAMIEAGSAATVSDRAATSSLARNASSTARASSTVSEFLIAMCR
jgi:hypothetical protein